MCNIHEHAVLIDYMVPKGSSFIGKHGPDFVHANDLAWVGFSVETGPDGGVYILDWHDQNICGKRGQVRELCKGLPDHAERRQGTGTF